jgi:AraC-like DNA-binding protein
VKLATKQEIYKRLQWTIEYMDETFTKDLGIDHFANFACLSPFHFKRLFKQVFKVSPYQYIKSKRIEKAAALLQSGYAVHEVCKTVGWEDTSSFIRLFKKTYARTPGKFQSNSLATI